MKILEPVACEDIPTSVYFHPEYDEIYRRALSANGLAVPVQFESRKQAGGFRSLISQSSSRGAKLGLRGIQRGNTVFVYRKP